MSIADGGPAGSRAVVILCGVEVIIAGMQAHVGVAEVQHFSSYTLQHITCNSFACIVETATAAAGSGYWSKSSGGGDANGGGGGSSSSSISSSSCDSGSSSGYISSCISGSVSKSSGCGDGSDNSCQVWCLTRHSVGCAAYCCEFGDKEWPEFAGAEWCLKAIKCKLMHDIYNNNQVKEWWWDVCHPLYVQLYRAAALQGCGTYISMPVCWQEEQGTVCASVRGSQH